MKKIFITLSFLFYSITAYCQHNFTVNLKNIATITFLDTPNIISPPDIMYSLDRRNKISHSGLYYQAETFHVKKNLLHIFNRDLLDTFYNYEMMGMLKATNGKLLYKKNIALNKIRGIEFGYEGNFNSKQPYYGYFQAFYINNTMISYQVMSYDLLQSDNEELKTFFSTFKLTIPDKDIEQGTFADIVMSTRAWIIAILTMLMGILIMYIGYKIKNRSYNNQ